MGRATKQDAANRAVEDALYRKATGYNYTQQDTFKLKNIEYNDAGKKVAETESVKVVEVQKYVPAEYSAIALWLKARMPEKWGEAAQDIPFTEVRIVDDIKTQNNGIGIGGKADIASTINDTITDSKSV